MKKVLFLTAAICLFSIAALAQNKKTDYSGTWTLDVSKSKLGDRNNIESQTLTIAQTASDIKVETATKRAAPPAGAPGGGGMGRGGAGGDGTATYTLDGKEVKSEIQSPMGSMAVSTSTKVEGGKLVVTRKVTTPNGDRVSSESWELSADGNTLTVTSQRPTRDGGTDTITRVYTKKV